MKIAITKESKTLEARVASSPEIVKKLVALGVEVFVEKEAGLAADYPDQAYIDAGATIKRNFKETVSQADLLLKVRCPQLSEIESLKSGCCVISIIESHRHKHEVKAMLDKKITALALDMVPRITRAQSMDILSSQANLAGYKSVLLATQYYKRAFPMMMTAAGTIPPAKVFVMGAGVAGLQAIATAKRLGAVVSATDVRPSVKEQVQSLGGQFVMVDSEEVKQAETAGGYAKEMSAEFKKAQQELIKQTLPKMDVVITTALIPGKPAPLLVTKEMVESMKPGSVIVDMASEQGGNCALTKAGKVIEENGVIIVGTENIPSLLASDASRLYAKNMMALVDLIVKEGKLQIPWDDEIIKAMHVKNELAGKGDKP